MIDAMTPEDFDAVLAIDVAAFEAHETGHRATRASQLREELARAWSRLRVARVDGAVAGYLLAWKVVDEYHLLNVAVAPDRRRAGLGRALVEDLLARAHEEGVVRILLEVRASNVAAVRLYEGLGFTTFNVRARYYDDGEDALEMERLTTTTPPP